MMTTSQRLFTTALVLIVTASCVLALQSSESMTPVENRVMPRYDDEKNLLLPGDYREWRFVGSSLGLSYTEGTPSHEMFHHTLMEPTAYDHYKQTGEFREGTMLVLMLHGTGEGELPQRRGRFAAEIHGVEMAVKDSSIFEEGWGYYNFGGMNGVRERVAAMPADACHSCHVEHARQDNVFTQFYPLLDDAVENAALDPQSEPANAPVLALKGLDPVMLIDGREEMGKPEIEMIRGGYRYQFVSEPTRARFEAEPDRYSIANDTCPVVPDATVDPELFVVHEGRIYVFASSDCVEEFKANPNDYLETVG